MAVVLFEWEENSEDVKKLIDQADSSMVQEFLEYKAGDLNIFKELKSQYEAEEWVEKREELFLSCQSIHI